MQQYDHVKLVRELEDVNRLAVVTPEEIRFLFDSLPAAPVGREVWDEQKREAYRSMYMNEEA